MGVFAIDIMSRFKKAKEKDKLKRAEKKEETVVQKKVETKVNDKK